MATIECITGNPNWKTIPTDEFVRVRIQERLIELKNEKNSYKRKKIRECLRFLGYKI